MANPKRSSPVLIWIIAAVLGLGCMALIALGALRIEQNVGLVCLASGIVGLVVVGAAVLVAIELRSGSGAVNAGGGASDAGATRNLEHLLAQIHQNSMLSDIAK